MFEDFEIKTKRSLIARDLFDMLQGLEDKWKKGNPLFHDDVFYDIDTNDLLMYWTINAEKPYAGNYHESCLYEFAKTFVDLLVMANGVPNEFLNYDSYFDFFDEYYDGDLIVQAAFWFHVENPDYAGDYNNDFFEFWNDHKEEIIETTNDVLTLGEMLGEIDWKAVDFDF